MKNKRTCDCGGVLRYCLGEDTDGNRSNYFECNKCGKIKQHRPSNTPLKCPVCKRTYAVYLYGKIEVDYYPWSTYGLQLLICPECEEEQ